MSKFCDLTGKGPMSGHNVSHSNRKLKRKFYPNLHKKSFFVPELDKWVDLKVSAKAMRIIDKKGIYAYLKELERKGKVKLDV